MNLRKDHYRLTTTVFSSRGVDGGCADMLMFLPRRSDGERVRPTPAGRRRAGPRSFQSDRPVRAGWWFAALETSSRLDLCTLDKTGPRLRLTHRPRTGRTASRPSGLPTAGVGSGGARATDVRSSEGRGIRHSEQPKTTQARRPGRPPRAIGYPTRLSPTEGGGGFNVSREGAPGGYSLFPRTLFVSETMAKP